MRAIHLLFILPILVVNGVTGQEAQHKDYLYLDIGTNTEYQPDVQRNQESKQKVGEDTNYKNISVSEVTSGGDAGDGTDVQVPTTYKGYKHVLKDFYSQHKELIKAALKKSHTPSSLSDGSSDDPTLQLKLQVAGRDLTLESTNSSAEADPLQYGSSDAGGSGAGGKNYLLVYLYQGTSTDTVPLLFKFGERYFGPKDKASYFTTWKEVTITAAGVGGDLTTAIKNKLDEINRQLNDVDLTQTGDRSGSREYGLETSGIRLTGGFQTKRIEVTQSTNPVSDTSSQYTTVTHSTTNGFNIGQIKVPSTSVTFINNHTNTLSSKTHNQAVAVYASTGSDSGPLGTPSLVLIAESNSRGSGSTVHGYYKVTGDSSSGQYEFKTVTPTFTLDQLTNKEIIKANTDLVQILENLLIVARQESQVQEQHVEQQQQESQVQEQHVEQQQQESQNKDYLYLDIGNKGARYEAFVENKTVGKVKVGEDRQITVAAGVGGTDAQVPDGYKGYNHGLKAFYDGAKVQIKKALKPESGEDGDAQDPELQLKLQVANRVITLFNEGGSIEAEPLKYGQDQSSGPTNDLVVYFYHKVSSSDPDTVPLLFKFGPKYYGPKDKASYFQGWKEYTITGNSAEAIKQKLDEINRELNGVDLAQTGSGSLQQEYGLVKGTETDLGTFQTKRIDVRKSQIQVSGGTSYPYVTHTTSNGYNIGNIGGLDDSHTFNNSHTSTLNTTNHNQVVVVYSAGDSSYRTPKLVFIAEGRGSSGDSAGQTSTIHGYYNLSESSPSGGQYEFAQVRQPLTLGDITNRNTIQSSCSALVKILESLSILAPPGPSGPQGPRGATHQQESQVQEQHVEQQQQTQLKDYLYLEIDKQVQYQPSVKRETGEKHKVGDSSETKIQVEGASDGSGDGGVDAKIPAGYKGFKIKLSDFYSQRKSQIKEALKTSHADSQLDSVDRDPELQLILQVGGQELALVDSNGSPVTSLLQYGKTQASGTENDPVVYFYVTGSTSSTPDTVPLLFKFGERYFGPKDKASYFTTWQELTIAAGDRGDALKQNIKRELDRINELLSEIDLTKTGVRGSSEGYGLETVSVPSLESFNTKRIQVTRSKIPGSNTSSAYTIVTHKTVNNYNVGSIKALNNCQFSNLHSTALTDQSHNEAVAVYRDGVEDSAPLENPQLVLICSSSTGSGTGGTSNVHGYYNLSEGCASTGNQYLFKKATSQFTLDQLSNRTALQSSYPDLVKVMETIARVTQPIPPGGGGAGGGGVPGHDATGLAPGSPRKPGTSSVGGSENERGIADPQAIPASTTSAPSAVSSSAPSVSQPGISSTIAPSGSTLGQTDDRRNTGGDPASASLPGPSSSSSLGGVDTVQASVLGQGTTLSGQSLNSVSTQLGRSDPDGPSVVVLRVTSSGQNVSGSTSLGRTQTSPLQTQSQLSNTRQQVVPGVGGRTGPGAGHPPVLPAQRLPNTLGGGNQVVGQVRTEQSITVLRPGHQGPQATTTTPAAGTTTSGPVLRPPTMPVVSTSPQQGVTTGIRDVTTTTNSLRGPIFSVTDRTANIARVRETTDNENLIATNIKRALTLSNFYGFENLPVAQENDAQSLKEYLFRAVRHLVRILENVKYNIAGDEEVIVRELDRNQVAYHQADLNLLNGIKFENKEEYYGLYNGFKNLYNAIVVRLNMMILQSDPMQVLKHVGSLSLIPHSVAVQLERQYGRDVLARVGPNDRAGRVASYPLLGFRIGIVATEEIMDRIQDVLARYLRLTGSRQPSDIVTLARKQLEGLQPISNLGQREFDTRVPDTPDAEVRELSGYLHSIANARNAGAEQPADSTTMDEVQSLMVQSVFTELTRQLVGDKVANYLEMLGESVLDEPESQASANQLTRVLASTPAQPEQPGSSEKPGLLGSIIEKTRRVASKVREKAQGLLKSGFGTESTAVPLAIALLMYTL